MRPAPSVASEELARRSSTEKAELAVANEHFSVELQQRQIERSSSDQMPNKTGLTVASEGQTRRKLAEKAELASANEHFSASLQRRMAERSRLGGTLALRLDNIGQLRDSAE
jgi:hypothetical protein